MRRDSFKELVWPHIYFPRSQNHRLLGYSPCEYFVMKLFFFPIEKMCKAPSDLSDVYPALSPAKQLCEANAVCALASP